MKTQIRRQHLVLAAALHIVSVSFAAVLLAGCSARQPPEAQALPAVATVAVDHSIPVQKGAPVGAALWLHPQDLSRSLVVAVLGDAGLGLHAMDGQSLGSFGPATSDFVSIAYGFDAGSGPGALLVAQDRALAALRAYVIDPASGKPGEITRMPLALEAELTGLCLHRSSLSGKHYAFAATDDGDLQQWELSARQGAVQGRVVRRIPVGKGAASCVVDDATGMLYLADETTGIWRIAADPESNTTRELLELVSPRGELGTEVKGLALHQAAGLDYLLAADEDAAAVHVFALPEGKHLGQFKLAGLDGAKFETIWAGGFAAEPSTSGLVLVPDESGAEGAIRMLRWDVIIAALKLPSAVPLDPRSMRGAAARTVEPSTETIPVDDFGDAADDPAIWVHPVDPAKSLIIGAQKKRGVEVYDLAGRRLQLLADGRTNNVDLRQGVQLGGRQRDIVAGSNRETRSLALYEMNATTRRLTAATAAPIAAGMRDPYGLCMYHSARSGKLYVFMNNSDAGEFRQWEILASGSQLTAAVVREFTVGSQAEGCAADDETGALYIAEEGAGLWRYGAEPDAGNQRRQIDTTAAGGNLAADVEGVGIFRGKDGAGWIVVSNQGADNYAVYRREGENKFVGHFSIVANDGLGIDGASETDGLEVSSRPLGPAFPQGLLAVQDGRNITPAERQNYKLVPWERVAKAMGL